jgi:hypothetical protein
MPPLQDLPDEDAPAMMTTEVMLARMRDYTQIGISQTMGLMMGGVFAAAAVTFMEILRSQDAQGVRLTGWLYGVVAALSVLDSVMRRTVIDARPKLYAVPLVGAAGLLSMLGFALLGPITGGLDGWRFAQLVVLLAGFLLAVVVSPSPADRVEPALRPFYERLAARGRGRNKAGWLAILLSVLPFALAMADKYGPMNLQAVIAALNLALCGYSVFQIVSSHRYFGRFYEEVYGIHAAKLKAASNPSGSPAAPRGRSGRPAATPTRP